MRRLTRNLRDSSMDAFIMALEVINSPSIAYRLEAFVFLFCNAWELLMKARLLDDGARIFYRKQRGKPRRSLSLQDCLNRLFTSDADPVKQNVRKVAELRDAATHLVVPLVPPDIMGVFQAGVLNYARKLQEWFSIALSDRVPLGMMALVFDADPKHHSLDSPLVRKKMPAETVKWLKEFQNGIRADAAAMGSASESFYIPINLKLAIVRNAGKADIVLSAGKGGESAVVIEVPKDPDHTHPFRQKEVVEQVNQRLGGRKTINSYDVQVVRKVHNVDSNQRFFYQSRLPNRSPQYSPQFVDWLVKQYEKAPGFFDRARRQARGK